MAEASRRLAAAIADRLGEVLPRPLEAIAVESTVAIVIGGQVIGSSPAAGIIDDIDDRTPTERACAACSAVLNGLQDDLAVYLTMPWPTDSDGNMAYLQVHVESGVLWVWFGEVGETAIRLRPIRVADL